ncbi:AraC family transcriptional regulator [Jannaschia pagri]|uniref:AraC family transcriptional regulator n=1 Tax=Jannaschia pagri TaxID=2829797 RepID=A0ABQ4NRN1_9RHOB|nr:MULTISPECIES: AraC family transcriptional regulator [unclassified Jannaschia]GIT93188.1 AraC family transcriptional regulator [Jannaschia sp. AI_61]GIT97045.1 AraC family transcriptional regulator [Jannaschia sp. AI_62]
MPRRYEDIYPSLPLLTSDGLDHVSAAQLMAVHYFRADPDEMPEDVFVEHHVLLNLKAEPHRVINTRNGEVRDFTFSKNDIIVTPAGMRSGWRWFAQSDVVVITLDPTQVQKFAETELGMLLDPQQLGDLPLFSDADLCAAGVMIRDALEANDMTSGVMFEALSRVFLVKLLQRYGKRRPEEVALSARFTSAHYNRVLRFIRENLERTISLDDLAREAGMSASHFSRLFKDTVGTPPMQYVMAYRIEQALEMMRDPTRRLGDIALSCGFADQAHFSRSFKQVTGETPRKRRAAMS